jgi:hypothetical protein
VAAGAYGDFVRRRSALYEPFFRDTVNRAPAGLVFVYRQSPAYLVPENMLGVVEYREPPADVPGMADITLDPTGRLVRFTAVPDRPREPLPAGPDWRAVFAEAGLDFGTFRPVETMWIPAVTSDQVLAWERGDATSKLPTAVMGAALNGRPVAFEAAPFSTVPDNSDSPLEGAFVFFLLSMGVLFGSAMLARRNIRQRRWDRVGARRLAAYQFVLGMVMGVLRADHVPRVEDEYLLLARITGWTLYICGFTFLIYAAFEPLVRRRWPRMLTSWTRLIAGRPRDALVGRDVLIGATAGVAVALLRQAEFIAARALGIAPPPPFESPLEGLANWQQFASLFLFIQAEALTSALGWLLILLLVRIVTRRDSIAAVVAVLVVLPITTLPGDFLLLELFLGLVIAALSLGVLFRFGLLALIVGIFVSNSLTRLPITLNASEWYVGRSLIALLCLSALMIYGFHTSLGGRPLVARRLVED